MKKILLSATLFFIVLNAKSQNLTVEGTAPNLYITHTVAPKENFYSVGRLYNQAPKSIASFNGIAMEKGLTIGQHIKIPLNTQNLDAGGSTPQGETLTPLTHVVAKSETLSKIAADNNVSAQAIKQWNNLSSDKINPGTPLVVGHLKMSAAGVAATSVSSQVKSQPVVTKQETTEVSKPVTTEAKKETAPAIAQTPEKKETQVEKQAPVKQTETVVSAPAKEKPVKEEVAKQAPVKVEETKKSDNYSYSNTGSMGSVEGVFANVFTTDATQKSLTSKNGEAATFKSTSGWQDKKYYVLMNDVTPGTILKVASSENKVVYAKVLGSMPDMKENSGLMMRISNAAASYLGIIDPKFPVQISFYQ